MKTTCIMCPMGCALEITEENGVISVSGNTCKRGETYGKAEFTCPVRVVTSLVKTPTAILSVKTDRPIEKSRIFEVLKALTTLSAPETAKIGDVLAADFLQTGANVVITGVTPLSIH